MNEMVSSLSQGYSLMGKITSSIYYLLSHAENYDCVSWENTGERKRGKKEGKKMIYHDIICSKNFFQPSWKHRHKINRSKTP